jgi:hypothetical protein
VTGKVAEVAPAATVTLTGTVAAEVSLLESVMIAPPVGAASFSVTVPVDPLPPVTLDGFATRDAMLVALTVSVAMPGVPLYVPVSVTCVVVPNADVVTGNVAEVAPAEIVTLTGTVAAAVLLLVSVTTAPPVGAEALSVTVPVAPVPPGTLVGFTDTDEITGGFTVSEVFWLPLYVPVSVACAAVPTGKVVTANVAEVAPAETVTLAETDATGLLLLVSATTAPPVGAAAFNATVPVEPVPPVTLVGFTETEEITGGFTVSEVFCVPLKVPVNVTCVAVPTAVVETGNVAEVAPAATVTLTGTVAVAVLLLVSVTTAPPVGAAVFNVNVPVDPVPPVTLVGFAVKDEILIA